MATRIHYLSCWAVSGQPKMEQEVLNTSSEGIGTCDSVHSVPHQLLMMMIHMHQMVKLMAQGNA